MASGTAEIDFDNVKVQQIIVAATQLFLTQGYDASSMDAISRAANVSKATLYAHFVNKEKLFAALVRVAVKSISEQMKPPPLNDTDLEQSLREVAYRFTTVFLDPRGVDMHRLIFAEATRFPEIGLVFAEWGPRRVKDMISDLLREATGRGLIDIPDPDLGAAHFMSLITADYAMERQLGIGPPSTREMKRLIESGIALFMRGYSNRLPASTEVVRPPPPSEPASCQTGEYLTPSQISTFAE